MARTILQAPSRREVCQWKFDEVNPDGGKRKCKEKQAVGSMLCPRHKAEGLARIGVRQESNVQG